MLYEFDGNRPLVGKNSYVSDTAQVIGNVIIGDNCYIGHGAILRGDYGRIEIGKGTAVEEGVIIHAPPNDVHRIGEKVTFGHGAIIHGRKIDNEAVIGMGSIISIYAEVGEWSIIAEGSVVKMNQIISRGVVAGGNPARVLREVSENDKEIWGWGKQLYIDLARKYLDSRMKPVANQ
ncbi:MAG TPA: gamma carbonic anhydrase family protein [Syntrophales bacterium]|nr:gamma carbonic anhydrase family protein [Syntrophales bacterium]